MSDVTTTLDCAARIARRHAGSVRAAALGLQLNHIHAPTPLVYTRYEPSFSFVLHGRKRAIIGEDDQEWGPERFLITPIDLPVIAQVTALGADGDFVSGNWRVDPLLVSEVLATAASHPVQESPTRLGTTTPLLAGALERLLELLDFPEEVPLLGRPRAQELVLRLLQTSQAARLHAVAGSARSTIVYDAITRLTSDYGAGWTAESLAAAVGTSAPTLNRRFRELTGMSPASYLKHLRLGEARRRLLVGGEGIARAAAAVGYLIASHFARDYRTAYGVSPSQDAAALDGQLRNVPWR